VKPDEIELLSNANIPEVVRAKIAEQLLSSQERSADRELETKRLKADRVKFLWNTPLVAALAGLLTLSATFIFNRITAKDTATNTITLEQIRAAIQQGEDRLKQELEENKNESLAKLEAQAKEREFEYEIVRSELTNSTKNNQDRAAVLLFLVKAGVLTTLKADALKEMAEAQIQTPGATIIPTLASSSPESRPTLFPELATNPDLSIDVQKRLSKLGYLDPPQDGTFGAVQAWALKSFLEWNGVTNNGHFGPYVSQALSSPPKALPELPKTGTWIDKIASYMTANNYWICRYPGCNNIVYLEGVDPDGNLNENRPNEFSDTRLVFWLDSEGKLVWKAWQATTEPGDFFTQHPMNPAGAARIAFGQYSAWAVGWHLFGRASQHEALVQAAPVSIYRDANKDNKREGPLFS
jgi:peptidoglycan hydrolase-like protein with peptidoglycan-binding domain